MVTTKTRKTFGNQALHAHIEPRPYIRKKKKIYAEHVPDINPLTA